MDMYYYPYRNTDEALKQKAWNKGRLIDGYDSREWRWDICGSVMQYSAHGEEGKYGWEIDHIYPKDKGGSDNLDNLQPLYWKNNRKKGDTYPWHCS